MAYIRTYIYLNIYLHLSVKISTMIKARDSKFDMKVYIHIKYADQVYVTFENQPFHFLIRFVDDLEKIKLSDFNI